MNDKNNTIVFVKSYTHVHVYLRQKLYEYNFLLHDHTDGGYYRINLINKTWRYAEHGDLDIDDVIILSEIEELEIYERELKINEILK